MSSQAAGSRPASAATAPSAAGGAADGEGSHFLLLADHWSPVLVLVFADDGYLVLPRPAGQRTAQALAHPLAAARLHTSICY